MFRYNSSLLILFLMLAIPCYSGESGLKHSLDDYIAYALLRNPAIKAARASVDAYGQEVKRASTLADPMIMGSVGIQDGFMPMGIGVSQMIMQPATLILDKKSARYRKAAEDAHLRQIKADIIFRVRSVYSMLYEAGQLIKIKQQNLLLLKQYEELTRTSYTTGSVAQSSLIKVGLEIARLEDDIRSDELKGESQRRELSAVLGISDAVDFPFPGNKPSWGEQFSPDTIAALVQAKFPALQAMDQQVQSEQVMARSAKSRFLPDFTIGMEYMRWPGGGMSDDIWMWSPSLSFSIPLWFWKKNAAVRSAEFSAIKMEHQTQDMRNMAEAEAVMNVNALQDARRKLELLDNSLIPQTRQMLTLMENEYRTGMSRSLDVLDAQRMLLDLEMESVMEQTRSLQAEAALLRLVGDTGKETVQ